MKKGRFSSLIVCSMSFLILLTGCGLNFTIKDPVPSNVIYSSQNMTPSVITIVDQRTGMDLNFLLGQMVPDAKMSETSTIKLVNIEDPIAYFAMHLEKELNSRQIPIKCVVSKSQSDGLTLVIHRYQIANIQATGFSPWESLHFFSGTLINGSQKTAIKSYFYNGKMPAWSMNEILEPCFNIPISIIIKDVASKINQAAFNLRASDQKVKSLTAEVDAQIARKDYNDFWKVLELGYTNNPGAIDPLKKFAKANDDFLKSCAISSIGTLGGAGEVEFLKNSYAEGWYNDRYMSAKALGDIATPEAIQALTEMKKDSAYKKEGGLKHCVDLYLQ